MVAFHYDQHRLNQICQKWHIAELAIFGSATREDFHFDSDVDLLVSFSPESGVSLYEFVTIRDEFAMLFGRQVDLVSRRGVMDSHNDLRKQAILSTAERIYVSGS